MAELVDAVDLKSIEGNLRESSSLSVAILGSRQVWFKAPDFDSGSEEVPPSLVRIQPAQRLV